MKIVHLITRLIAGGADENTVLTCNAFVEAGHEITIIHGREVDLSFSERLDPRVRRISIPHLRREHAPVDDIRALFALSSLLREIRPDIIHTHTSKAGFVGRLASLAVPDAAVVHGIHILPFVGVRRPARIVYTLMETIAARFTDVYISVSDGMRALALDVGLGNPEHHLVARSGMEIHRFKALRKLNRDDTSGPLRVLYLANYESRKGHAALLAAIARNSADLEGAVRFVFAGRGNERDALVRFVDENALGGIVEVGGFSADPVPLLAEADLGIYCSSNEGLPRAIVQYFAAGLPVVAMDLPGLDGLLKCGVNGLSIEQGDFDGLVNGVVRLAGDHELRASMRRACHHIDLSAWSVEAMCDVIQEGYSMAAIRRERRGSQPGPRLLQWLFLDRGVE